MAILWSAVLTVAVFICLSTSSMAYTKHGRAEHVQVHGTGGTCAKKGCTASKTSPSHRGTHAASARDHSQHTHAAGLVRPLAEKVSEIVSACGSRVISGVRHTRVAGTNTVSLHATGQAADIQGNPGCVYQHLQGWAGGYTTDYNRVHHVHVSFGGREQGLRFVHGGHSPSRHARRHVQIARG